MSEGAGEVVLILTAIGTSAVNYTVVVDTVDRLSLSCCRLVFRIGIRMSGILLTIGKSMLMQPSTYVCSPPPLCTTYVEMQFLYGRTCSQYSTVHFDIYTPVLNISKYSQFLGVRRSRYGYTAIVYI